MSSNKQKITKRNMNKKVANCLKPYTIIDDKERGEHEYKFHTEKEYDDSFKNEKIYEFEKSVKKINKNRINLVLYNVNNADGLFSSYIAWRYLYHDKNGKDEPRFVGMGPYQGKGYDPRLKYNEMEGKHILICDLSYGIGTLERLKQVAKSVIIIDDHVVTKVEIEGISQFVGEVHGACAYVWKFFYPKQYVPKVIQAIDTQDRPNIGLSYMPFTHYLKSAIEFQFNHNQTPSFLKNKYNMKTGMYPQLHEIVEMDEVNLYIFFGKCAEAITENIKYQVAQNARVRKFQGYTVAVLNHIDPVMTKKIAKQIITNFKESGTHIDFVVMWSYQYTIDAYNIQMSEDHYLNRPPKYNLPQMAKKLAEIGKVSRGGGGSGYVGNFYWPHKKGMDIWDLFEKQYL